MLDEIEKYNDQIEALIKRAGDTLLEYWPGGTDEKLEINTKGDGSLITAADLASNAVMKEELKKLFPDHTILSEEEDIQTGKTGNATWLFDPLDGTTMFSKGGSDFAILLAHIEQETVTAGYMYFPVHNQMLRAAKGKGAFEDGVPLTVKVPKESRISYRGVGSSKDAYIVDEKYDSQIAFYKLAHSELSAVILPMAGLGNWDIAAPSIILSEAGATVSDERGANLSFLPKAGLACKTFVAANSHSEWKNSLSII